MKTLSITTRTAAVFVGLATILATRGPTAAQNPAPAGDSWTRAISGPAERGKLFDAFQNVRGDSGKWSDAATIVVAPALVKQPAGTKLDDWFDTLVEAEDAPRPAGGEVSLLLRTRQLDDNDRLWIERIERQGNKFTVVLNEAVWQGKYFKTFTFYHVYGVNLGRLAPGEYEAQWIVQPRSFAKFDGDGRPAEYVNNRQIDHWPIDDAPAKKPPTTLQVKFRVAAQ